MVAGKLAQHMSNAALLEAKMDYSSG